MDDSEAYTVQEAARILRTTERTIRRRLERGDLEGTRDPTTGRWRVAAHSVTEAMPERPPKAASLESAQDAADMHLRAREAEDHRAALDTGSQTTLKRPTRTDGYWSVPKKDLVFPAVAAFQQGKIRIAKGIKDRDALANELRNYRRTTNIATGNMAFEPWRESEHDDLLFAVCLSLWGWQTRKGSTRLRVIR